MIVCSALTSAVRPLWSIENCTACALPLSISTKRVMTSAAAKQRMKRKMKASQLFPVRLMIAEQTLGPMSEEARLVMPKRPKNTARASVKAATRQRCGEGRGKLTPFVARRGKIAHHGLCGEVSNESLTLGDDTFERRRSMGPLITQLKPRKAQRRPT